MKKIYSWFVILLLTITLTACGKNDPSERNYGIQTISNINSSVTGVSYQVDVYVPKDYEQRQGPLPVIYASDGQWLSEEYAELVIDHGEPIILVAIHDSGKRSTDFLPPGVADYYLFLTQELIPDIESRFDIEPSQRTLVGHSYGGAMATYVMLSEEIGAEYFKNFIIADPSIWAITDEIYELEAQRYLQSASLDVNVVFSSSIGYDGNHYWVHPFYDVMSDRNYQYINMSPLIVYDIAHGYMADDTFKDSLPILFPTQTE